MFAYKSIECLHQLLKSRHLSDCCSISLNPYMVFQTWDRGRKKRKWKAILLATILLAYIADVSCLTNRPFYMRTLSLR